MQKNEVIIDQFVKTINESPIEVSGDPILLNKIFDGLAQRKKRRKIFGFSLLAGLVLIGSSFVVWGLSHPNKDNQKYIGMIGISNHNIPDLTSNLVVSNDTKEMKNDTKEVKKVAPIKKSRGVEGKNKSADFSKSVTYKFNNHQVDVFQNGEEEFIQINVFGADGIEQDVLKIVEDLKKSYKSNEVYVDSVKHK